MNNNIIEENSADRIDSLKFEDLNTKDQLSKLESVYGELSKKFLEEYNDDVIRGNLFISDVSFNSCDFLDTSVSSAKFRSPKELSANFSFLSSTEIL